MKHRRCAVVGRLRVPSCPYVEFFPASRQRQSRAASMRMRMYTQRASHCYFLQKCHLVTQIESFPAVFSRGGSANNRKEPCQETRVPVEPQECCVWPRKFESALARISQTLSTRPNYQSKWNVPNQCLSPPPLQVLRRWHDGPAWPKSTLGQWARHFGLLRAYQNEHRSPPTCGHLWIGCTTP